MDMDSERDMDINEAKISNSCGYTFEMGECKRLVSDNSDITSIQNEFWQQDTLTGSGVGLLSSNKKSSTRNFSGPRLSSTLMTCRFLRVRRVPSPWPKTSMPIASRIVPPFAPPMFPRTAEQKELVSKANNKPVTCKRWIILEGIKVSIASKIVVDDVCRILSKRERERKLCFSSREWKLWGQEILSRSFKVSFSRCFSHSTADNNGWMSWKPYRNYAHFGFHALLFGAALE